MGSHRVAVLAGDGIGTEVVPAAISVLETVAAIHGFSFAWHELPWSCAYYAETGRMMPEDGLATLSGSDAIFLGAIGDPSLPDHLSLWQLLLPIRRRFRQYVNLRPIRLMPGVTSPLREPGDIDFVVVRENNEGEYSEIGGRLHEDTSEELAFQGSVFTRAGTERIIRYAFELARTRRGRLVSATKSNGLPHSMPFWDQICREISADYPDVEVDVCHVDALAARFVQRPESLDVVVASNLFGDVLTDLGAAVVGSIGIAPSANLNPEGEHPSMFEPIHGSAPDIAGRGIANPVGQLWSGVMMLEHLGHPDAGAALMEAIERSLADAGTRTADLGGSADTGTVTEAIREHVERVAQAAS